MKAILTRAVLDGMAFADSQARGPAELWAETVDVVWSETGIEIDESFFPMWRRVFVATVEGLIDYDWSTGFEHAPV